MSDLEEKKAFLYQSALLYSLLIKTATDDTVRRYLAFHIIVDAMSFEDLLGSRTNQRLREIRNVLLAHKQEPEFFEGYKASDEIRDATINPLVDFMKANTNLSTVPTLPELNDPTVSAKFTTVADIILKKFHDDEVAGFRVTNNFLCFPGNHVHEISRNDLAGCFYRYNSSKSLTGLAQYLFNNLHLDPDLKITVRHAKRDLILHAMNLADCVFKDTRNRHSIDGLNDIMKREAIGDVGPFSSLAADQRYVAAYQTVREVRNKIVGHMDRASPLADLMNAVDSLPIGTLYTMINSIDFAVYSAARSHIAVWARYVTSNARIPEDTQFKILDIPGLKPTPYFQ